MITTAGTTATLSRVLPITATTNYTAANLHVEIVYPDKTIKWLEGGLGEVSFSVVNSVLDISAGSLTATVTLSAEGKYKLTVYEGTTGSAYTKLGYGYITKITDTNSVSF